MDVLYIPQLDDGEGGGSDGTAGRYRLLKRVPEDGTVNLTERAVTRVELAANDPLRLVVPPLVKGAVRDFFVRLVITADEIPEVTFAPVVGPSGDLTGGGYSPAGETISFEDVDEDVFKCEVGVNVYAFTETDQGIFIVNRKQVDIDPSGQPKYYGRFNQGVVTVNLVDAGLSADGDLDAFWEILDERLELCHKALQCRHRRLRGVLHRVAVLEPGKDAGDPRPRHAPRLMESKRKRHHYEIICIFSIENDADI